MRADLPLLGRVMGVSHLVFERVVWVTHLVLEEVVGLTLFVLRGAGG